MNAKKEGPLRQPASTSQEANGTAPNGDSYLLYSTPRSKSQDKARRLSRGKLKLVAALICAMFFVLLAMACWLWPPVIPYVLAPFAVAGAWKFCRVTYIWLSTDPVFTEEEQPW